ncbi:MvaI/BcnI family restriction endonuclease [Fontisphaera persica]|uniref:MvaI/BcnI family restriction endonuclease n=1 Tax=Fontisphaera persica TaxID=2974023 RepID=UPI0024C0323A|nr:MvaI/BcnI family restriction endonuclease [Fontisphaera persica]WCJ59319.1 MvaI/BcnI family restriction endonuclease [Fontisphaera persica]
MDRKQAVEKLRELVGKDLRPLADCYEVTVWRGNKKNKGWAGHVLERYLGIPINSSQSPNFGSWELKVVPLKKARNDRLILKETMAITMIDPYNVVNACFECSHLLQKLQKLVVCARIFESQQETKSILHCVATFDLNNEKLYNQVKADYELVRNTIRQLGFDELTGKMGVYIQPRTKGAGHGSTTRAFYARKQFVAQILGI